MFSNDLRCFLWQMSSFSSDFAVGHQLILQLYMMIDTAIFSGNGDILLRPDLSELILP